MSEPQTFAEAMADIRDRYAKEANERYRVGWSGGTQTTCPECGSGSYHKEGCSTEAKRAALQAKLESTHIDETKLKDRTVKRSIEVLAHDVRRKLLERAEKLIDTGCDEEAALLVNAAKGLE